VSLLVSEVFSVDLVLLWALREWPSYRSVLFFRKAVGTKSLTRWHRVWCSSILYRVLLQGMS
jgi:hypothetical protein